MIRQPLFLIAMTGLIWSYLPINATAEPRDLYSEPRSELQQEMVAAFPNVAYQPAPPISQRGEWNRALADKNLKPLIARAEKCLAEPPPSLPDELYRDYLKTGNRRHFEDPYFRRTANLTALSLAELAENQGRFLPAIEKYLQAILAEKTWVLPAHDRNSINFTGKGIDFDLGSGDRAATLSTVISLLGEKLSAELKRSVRSEIRRRIIDPYLQAARQDNTPYGFWWLHSTNNWNAVCHANLVYTALIISDSREERAEITAHAIRYLNYFIAGFTPDGYCSEGIGYWDYGFGQFLWLGLVLRDYSHGKIALFQGERLHAVATYPQRFRLNSQLFPIFADGKMGSGLSPFNRLALASGFAIPMSPLSPDDLLKGTFPKILLMLFTDTRKLPLAAASAPLPDFDWFPDAGVMIMRGNPAANPDGPAIAVKAGNNGEMHNHNDVGSYTVAFGRLQPCCDPGGEIYTRRTFSAKRYESALLNSWGHPVPVINGEKQPAGAEYCGTILQHEARNGYQAAVIDLKNAYSYHGLLQLTRTVRNDARIRNSIKIVVRDNVEFNIPSHFGTAIITFEHFTVEDHRITFTGDGKTVTAEISSEGGEIKLTPEPIQENSSSGKTATRIGIDFKQPIRSGSITVIYTSGQ